MYRFSEPRLRPLALYVLLDPPRSKQSSNKLGFKKEIQRFIGLSS